ncbi:MAG: two-component sensor histidine kinase [Rhodospirillales bacterium]|nr:two-component sensor histidine kinase [Rhodospirillales bacterium]
MTPLEPWLLRALSATLWAPRWPLGTALIIGSATLVLAWLTGAAPWIGGWYAALGMLIAIRMVLRAEWQRAGGEPPQKWMRRFTITACAHGLLWGALGAALAHDDWNVFTVVLVLIAGLCAGSATVYAGWPRAVGAFLAAAMAPLAVACLLRGDAAGIALGLLSPFFAFNLLMGARRAFREKVELLRQRAELERTAEELEQALLMTQRAEAARTRFLATVSHELRTPLNAIVGFADLMQSEAMGPLGSHHYRDYVTDIGDGARRLRRLVDEIVAFARLDAPSDIDARSLIDVRVPCREAAATVASDATARGIILTLLLDETVPARLLDGGALTRALRHLLENAVKFSERGQRVRLVVSRRDADGIEIRVEDRGAGMDELALAQALLPFRQLEETIVRQVDGLGLGLPLARALIEREGGRLELESAPGRGTIARVVFT